MFDVGKKNKLPINIDTNIVKANIASLVNLIEVIYYFRIDNNCKSNFGIYLFAFIAL